MNIKLTQFPFALCRFKTRVEKSVRNRVEVSISSRRCGVTTDEWGVNLILCLGEIKMGVLFTGIKVHQIQFV